MQTMFSITTSLTKRWWDVWGNNVCGWSGLPRLTVIQSTDHIWLPISLLF